MASIRGGGFDAFFLDGAFRDGAARAGGRRGSGGGGDDALPVGARSALPVGARSAVPAVAGSASSTLELHHPAKGNSSRARSTPFELVACSATLMRVPFGTSPTLSLSSSRVARTTAPLLPVTRCVFIFFLGQPKMRRLVAALAPPN